MPSTGRFSHEGIVNVLIGCSRYFGRAIRDYGWHDRQRRARHAGRSTLWSCRAYLYGKLLVALLTQKLLRFGRAIIPPSGLFLSARRTMREFSFVPHQIQQAIEPNLSLQQTLSSWNQIAQSLEEESRKRLLQLTEWDTSRSPASKVNPLVVIILGSHDVIWMQIIAQQPGCI